MILRLVKIGSVVCLLITIGLLIHHQSSSDRTWKLDVAPDQKNPLEQENWMGVYWNGHRVGSAYSSIKRAGDRIELSDHSVLQLPLAGTQQRVETKMRSLANPDYSLRSFFFQLSSAGSLFSVHGVVEPKQLQLTVTAGKETQRRTMALTQAPLLAHAVIPALTRKGVEVGKQYRVPFFDPATMDSSDILVTVEAEEERICGGKPFQTLRMRQSFKGLESLTWATREGITVAEEGPLGFTLLREDRQTALAAKPSRHPPGDLLAAAAVSAHQRIPHPDRVSRLKVALNNTPLSGLDLDGGRQQLHGKLLVIQRESAEGWFTYPLPCRRNDLQRFLKADLFVQSDHPRIGQQAQKIISGTQDAAASVRLLVEWVSQAIQTRPLVSIPSSLEVLDLKAGDCNEHTILFTALARSCGIPTRICTGLMYFDDRFYYHAWSEVFLGTWVAVDPTLNQFPADATHVRLLIGDLSNQTNLLSLVGRLSLDIAEYS